MTALAIRDDQEQFDEFQVAVLRQSGVDDDVTNAELAAFLHTCQRRQLDPFAQQIYLIGRYDRMKGRKVYKPQTSIDGFRLIARRAADRSGIDYEYEDTVWFDGEGRRYEVWLSDRPPAAAKVVVVRNGRRFDAVARYAAYVQTGRDNNPSGQWRNMADTMIAKCFSPDTEVLTDRGFRRFSDVGHGRVLQVTKDGIQPVSARPFMQRYDGPMVVNNGDMLNFAVTPNHDMVTTFGKVEAAAMYATTSTRGPWRIPLTAPGRTTEAAWSDDDLRLAGYVGADGTHNGHRLFNVAVSRPHKIVELAQLNPQSTRIVHASGAVAATSVREVRSNFDKTLFTFPADRVSGLLGTDKAFNVETLLSLSQRQARILIDAWQYFDGSTNRKTSVRRIYTSREDHVAAIEVLAVLAGYSVNVARKRESDITSRPGFYLTISEPSPQPVVKPTGDRQGVHLADNAAGEVWCVTVPSGQIVVRRNGFAMVCGNCAESLALRKAFPEDLGGLYTAEEMGQADNATADPQPTQAHAERADGRPRRPSQPVTDEGWFEDIKTRVRAIGSREDGNKLWREINTKRDAGQCAADDVKELRQFIATQVEIVEAAAASEATQEQPDDALEGHVVNSHVEAGAA